MPLADGKFVLPPRARRIFRSRLAQIDFNQLGRTGGKVSDSPRIRAMRNPALEVLDSYYESRQYSGMPPWDQEDPGAPYIPVRKRMPRIQMSFARMLSSRVASKLIGKQTWPKFTIEDDELTNDYFQAIMKNSKLRSRLLEPMRRNLGSGAVFVRFAIIAGRWKFEHFLSKYCFPKFSEAHDLEEVSVIFVFEDKEDLDDKKKPKLKWSKRLYGNQTDTLFKPIDFKEGVEPIFTDVVETVEHGLGFVQGQWFKTSDDEMELDGVSIFGDVLGFIDEMNYNMSQSSQVIQFNQDPQLLIQGMNEDEIGNLIRSSMKGWNLGKAGKAEFLETELGAVERAQTFRDTIRLNIGDISRVVLMDPEKMVAHAQSAKALEVLHGPFVELINELRPVVQDDIIELIQKMALANLIVATRGGESPITVPPGFQPTSLDLNTAWPPIFAATMEDMLKKVQVATSASSANLISRKTGLKFIADDFGVEDIDQEVADVDAQPVINPFGAF